MRPRKPFDPRHSRRKPQPPTSQPASAEPRDSADPSTHWGEVAEWYDQLVGPAGSEYHREVVIPGVQRLLACLPGDNVLDVACGQGVLCRVLHGRGVRVTGLDLSNELLTLARERSAPEIQYVLADARDFAQHPPFNQADFRPFRAAACVLAIQNIDPIQNVFEQVAAVLGHGGRLVIAMMHPCFRGPRTTAWDWDAERKIQYRRVERYLLAHKEAIITHPGRNSSQHTWDFHRALQSYFKALRLAGFMVDALEEWPSHKTSDSGPRAAAENAARKEIPLFLALRAVKVATGSGAGTSSNPD